MHRTAACSPQVDSNGDGKLSFVEVMNAKMKDFTARRHQWRRPRVIRGSHGLREQAVSTPMPHRLPSAAVRWPLVMALALGACAQGQNYDTGTTSLGRHRARHRRRCGCRCARRPGHRRQARQHAGDPGRRPARRRRRQRPGRPARTRSAASRSSRPPPRRSSSASSTTSARASCSRPGPARDRGAEPLRAVEARARRRLTRPRSTPRPT